MDRRKKTWVAFEGAMRAKPLPETDLEYFEAQTFESEDLTCELNWMDELFDIQDRLEEGSILAIHEGVSLCYEEQIPLPDWLNDAIKRLVVCLATNTPYEKVSRGRSNSLTAKMREELKLYLRKNAVVSVRRYQALEPCQFSFLLLPIGLKRKYNGQPPPDLGSTIEEAIEHATVSLRGSFAQASSETVRKAYFHPDGDGWGPWIFSRSDVLEAIGVQVPNEMFLPYGLAFSQNGFDGFQSYPHLDLPAALIPAMSTTSVDPISEGYLTAASGFEDFDEFIGIERKKRTAGKA